MAHIERPPFAVRGLSILSVLLASMIPLPLPAAGPNQEGRMVMTVLEAHVPPGRLGDVERVFRDGMSPLPADIVESFLVRDTKDPSLFRLTTVWRSLEALQAMRASGEKPKGVQMFEAVGASPTLSVFDIVVHSHR
jgi:hypothetical protein